MTTPAENDSRPEEASRLEDMPELPAQAKSNLFANLLREIGLLFTFTVRVCLAASRQYDAGDSPGAKPSSKCGFSRMSQR